MVGLVGSGLASSLRAKLGDTTDGLMEGLLTEGEARASGLRDDLELAIFVGSF